MKTVTSQDKLTEHVLIVDTSEKSENNYKYPKWSTSHISHMKTKRDGEMNSPFIVVYVPFVYKVLEF